MLPVDALCFYQAQVGRTVHPATLGASLLLCILTMSQSFGVHASGRRVSHRPCVRQAHCFLQGPLLFLPVPPNPRCARSHIWGFLKRPPFQRPLFPMLLSFRTQAFLLGGKLRSLSHDGNASSSSCTRSSCKLGEKLAVSTPPLEEAVQSSLPERSAKASPKLRRGEAESWAPLGSRLSFASSVCKVVI